MRVEGRVIFPHFDHREMVLAREVLEQFESHDAGVFAAVGGELLQELRAIHRVVGSEIDVRDDVQLGILAEGCKGGCQE